MVTDRDKTWGPGAGPPPKPGTSAVQGLGQAECAYGMRQNLEELGCGAGSLGWCVADAVCAAQGNLLRTHLHCP